MTEEPAPLGHHSDEPVLVIRFEECPDALILNRANTRTFVSKYGDETDEWVGRDVTLYQAWATYQGRQVPALRIKRSEVPAKPTPAPRRSEPPWGPSRRATKCARQQP